MTGTGLTLIVSADAWLKYQHSYKDACADELKLRWGREPARYPCLATSIVVPAEDKSYRVHTCFVYESDAARLLEAGGHFAKIPGPSDECERQVPSWTKKKGEQAAKPPEDLNAYLQHLPPGLIAYFCGVNALLLTITEAIISVGCTTEKRFERQHARFLAQVEGSAVIDVSPKGVLDRIDGKNQEDAN